MNIIERKLVINAPLDKVWQTIGTKEGMSEWFNTTIEGEWVEGASVTLTWPSGSMNEIQLVRIDPPTEFSYRWHPGESAMLNDYPDDQLTTVSMSLRETSEGAELFLTETGFENVSDDRRSRVLGLNSEGWDEEIVNIKAHAER